MQINLQMNQIEVKLWSRLLDLCLAKDPYEKADIENRTSYASTVPIRP